MLYTAQRLLAFVFVPFAFRGHCNNVERRANPPSPPKDHATLINDVWNDDYDLATKEQDSWKGWFIVNKGTFDDEDMSTQLSVNPITGSHGQKYWGELEQKDAHMIGPDNYFIRWFKCKSDARAVVVEYYTAGCGQKSKDALHEGVDQEITRLYVNYYGDMDEEGNPTLNYQSTLGKPEGGYNAFEALEEEGYELVDNKMKYKCRKGSRNQDRSYWVQRHGTKWIPPQKDVETNENVLLPGNQRFRTVIEVETGRDASGRAHHVLFYNFKMQCIYDEDSDENAGSGFFESVPKTSPRNIGIGLGALGFLCISGFFLVRCCKKRSVAPPAAEIASPQEYLDAVDDVEDVAVVVDDSNLSQQDLEGYNKGAKASKKKAYDMRQIMVEDESESVHSNIEFA